MKNKFKYVVITALAAAVVLSAAGCSKKENDVTETDVSSHPTVSYSSSLNSDGSSSNLDSSAPEQTGSAPGNDSSSASSASSGTVNGKKPLNSSASASTKYDIAKKAADILASDRSDRKITDNGTETILGKSADAFIVSGDYDVIAKVAVSSDNTVYYDADGEGIYRRVEINGSNAVMQEPVSLTKAAAKLICSEIHPKASIQNIEQGESGTVNSKECSIFIVSGQYDVMARVAVSSDGSWYYDEGALGNYKSVVYSKGRPVLK